MIAYTISRKVAVKRKFNAKTQRAAVQQFLRIILYFN